MLYDADRIAQAAAVEDETRLHDAQLELFLDPNDVAVQQAAREADVSDEWLAAARRSPVYKLAVEWKLAFPLHPEYRTLPMVWYCPPLSPLQAAAQAKQIRLDGGIPDVRSLRIPLRYLANLLSAGDEEAIARALERMLAMRAFMRARQVDSRDDVDVLRRVGLEVRQVEEMYHLLAIANYEDRFVIPTAHREEVEDAYELRGGCGFTFGEGCHPSTPSTLFGNRGVGRKTQSEVM
jgi:nitrate reductase beta subunit